MSQFGRFILSSQPNGDILERKRKINSAHIQIECATQYNRRGSIRGDVGRLFYAPNGMRLVYKTITKCSIKYILNCFEYEF